MIRWLWQTYRIDSVRTIKLWSNESHKLAGTELGLQRSLGKCLAQKYIIYSIN